MDKKRIEDLDSVNILELLSPFPLVLVSVSDNIITINQIHYFTFSPLRIGIGVACERFSYSLINEKEEFVINIPNKCSIDAVKTCGETSGKYKDKFEICDFSKEKSIECDSFTIKELDASIECKVERKIEFENRTWFVGKVVAAKKRIEHVNDSTIICGRHKYRTPGELISKR